MLTNVQVANSSRNAEKPARGKANFLYARTKGKEEICMIDKNGKEIVTGDIVKIEGAYFKNDNGLYFVTHSQGDKDWSGSGHGLKRIGKRGKISQAKYSTSFWPICIFTNDRVKRSEGNAWNKEHAKIEIVDGIPLNGVIEFFRERVKSTEEQIKREIYNCGKDAPTVKEEMEIKAHYESVIEYLTSK